MFKHRERVVVFNDMGALVSVLLGTALMTDNSWGSSGHDSLGGAVNANGHMARRIQCHLMNQCPVDQDNSVWAGMNGMHNACS